LILIVAVVAAAVANESDSNQQSPAIGTVSSSTTLSEPAPKPTARPIVEVNAEEILNDYRSNETAANLKWKGRRLLVTLQNIDRIEDGGRVIKNRGIGLHYIELDFVDVNQVIHLAPGDIVTANCKLDGFQLDTWLQFNDCRME
jgi:hypothetical protein